MELNEAMKTLQKLGRSDEIRAVLEQAVTKAQRSYEPILKDTTTSDSYKNHLLAKAYVRHTAEIADQLSAKAASAISSDRDDASRVFGVRGLAGDPASLAISRRDAADRVAKVEDARELQTLLRNATRSGDEALARAVAERGVHLGNAEIVNEFTSSRADIAPATERLWATRQQGPTSNLMNSLVSGALISNMKPTPLQRKGDYEISQLAAEQA